MLGYDLCNTLNEKHSVIALARGLRSEGRERHKLELVKSDITDKDGLFDSIQKRGPDLIIHTAALADVDYCELNPEAAFNINSAGTKNVADAAGQTGSYLIHISTDYVFDGTKDSPYEEDDEPNPISVYGRSKLEAERYIQAHLRGFLIIRSSWLFGAGGTNFIDVALESARQHKRIEAISDKYGSPTYTLDLSRAISDLIDKVVSRKIESGIYHITNAGVCSRYQLMKEILEYCNIEAEVIGINAKDAGGPALRPKMSALDNSKVRKALGYNLRHYSEACKEYLKDDKKERIK